MWDRNESVSFFFHVSRAAGRKVCKPTSQETLGGKLPQQNSGDTAFRPPPTGACYRFLSFLCFFYFYLRHIYKQTCPLQLLNFSFSPPVTLLELKHTWIPSDHLLSDQRYLPEGPCSGVGAEEAAEATGSAVLPSVGSGTDAGQGSTDLSQSIRGWNIRLPQELCYVLPPSRLTLQGRQRRDAEKFLHSVKDTMKGMHNRK